MRPSDLRVWPYRTAAVRSGEALADHEAHW